MVIPPKVFTSRIEESSYTCIAIGPADVELPSYLLQGQKAPGYIIRVGEEPQRWYWKGLTIAQGMRCLYFDTMDIYSITEIALSKRSSALSLARELAQALATLPLSFLDLSSNVLPLWRVWGIEGGGFLILSQDIADLFSSCAEEEVRYSMVSAWVHHGLHTPFALCDQMVQLLYYAGAGFPPFGAKESREDGFRALPLRLCSKDIDQKTILFIDTTLRLSLAKQREASGNKEPQRALSWFVEATEHLPWGVINRVQAPSYQDMHKEALSAQFLANQKKRADQKVFWRNKGWMVVSVTAIVVVIVWFTTARIKDALAPPYTAGMSAYEVIQEYYHAQNELDLQKMEASLAKKVKNPSAMEVTNLFVSRQTRKAYEGVTTQVDPNVWIAEGRPPLLEGTFLYGVSDIEVEEMQKGSYKVLSTLYSPYPYFEEEEVLRKEGEVVIFRYKQSHYFTLEESKGGWLEITSLEIGELTKMENLIIPTSKKERGVTGTPR